MDENTSNKLCFEIVDRLARNKVWGIPSLPYPDEFTGFGLRSKKKGKRQSEERKKDRLKLEAERLAFTDCHTLDISELQNILQSHDGTKQLPSVAYFQERVLRYGDERGVEKARAYEPGKIGRLYPGVRLGQDQASRDFLYYLTSPPDQTIRFVAPYFKKGDERAKEVAQKLRETVNEVLGDKTYFAEPTGMVQPASPQSRAEKPEETPSVPRCLTPIQSG